MSDDHDLSKTISDEIEHGVTTYWKWSRIFDWSSGILILFSILLSFIAAVNTAGKFIPNEVPSAIIAGLPALLLSIDRTFKLRARSDWFWTMLIHYQEIQRAIERKEIDFKEASHKISEIESNGYKEFPKVAYPG